MGQTASYLADILARDARGTPLLLVEVKAIPIRDQATLRQLVGYLTAAARGFPYVMLVDHLLIRVFRMRDGRADPLLELRTPEIVRAYEPEMPMREINHGYLVGLVEAWLHDLSYNWNSAAPPGLKQIEKAGLARVLKGCTTALEAEIDVAYDPLP
jgi:hypothetical protein